MRANVNHVFLAALLVAACGPRIVPDSSDTDGASSSSSTGSVTSTTGSSGGGSGTSTTTGSSSGGSGTSTTSSSGGTSSTDSGGCLPLVCSPPDVGCDVWQQDCPEGEKCAPWANEGNANWNDFKCVPIAPGPKGEGDPCTAEDDGTSGLDDCDLGLVCHDFTGEGVCFALCSGDMRDPGCANPDDVCVFFNAGVIALCLPTCDPLAPDCPTGQVCAWPSPADAFVCMPATSGDTGAYGDPCEYVNACDPRLFCAPPDRVPGCTGAIGCCDAFCDLQAGEACPDAAEGQVCTPWFADGIAPPGLENVGGCAVEP